LAPRGGEARVDYALITACPTRASSTWLAGRIGVRRRAPETSPSGATSAR
jgi:hypothetical protein